MQQEKTRIMHLPYEIIFQILIRLPVESLLRLKLVCKLWRTMISDREFIKAHLKRSKTTINIRDLSYVHWDTRQMVSVGHKQLDLKTVPTSYFPFQSNVDGDQDDYPQHFHKKAKLLASCNGLLLLSEGERSYYLWNPSTRLYKQLNCRGPTLFKNCRSAFALGYDEVCDAYKIVRILRVASYMDRNFFRHPDDNSTHQYDATSVKVYNCKTESWKKLEGVFPYNIFRTGQGVTVNGAPHWRVFRKEEKPRGIMNFVIIYFDFVEENFKEVGAPNWFVRDSDTGSMCALDEQLCLVRYVSTNSSIPYSYSRNAEIWVMKEYGVSESWTHLFTINNAHVPVEPLCFRTDRKLLIDKSEVKLVLYDLDEPNLDAPNHVDAMSFAYRRVYERTTYVESLVSPLGGNATVG